MPNTYSEQIGMEHWLLDNDFDGWADLEIFSDSSQWSH